MFEELFRKIDFRPVKVFREGPRVYVFGGSYKGKRSVFKSAFSGGPTLTSKNLHREAIFLASVPHLRPFVPEIYAFGTHKKRFWYLTEWVWPGRPQTVGESDFLMPNKFFTQKNLRWTLGVLAALRRASLSGENPRLRRELSRTFYDLSAYQRLLFPQGRRFFARTLLGRAQKFLGEAAPLYHRFNRTTLTHHEFYGSQILQGRSLKLTDWENLGWGHPLRDFTTLYLRAFRHPAWQEELLEKFRRQIDLDPFVFETLFRIEKILQSFGNLAHFDRTKLPEERRVRSRAMRLFKNLVREALI